MKSSGFMDAMKTKKDSEQKNIARTLLSCDLRYFHLEQKIFALRRDAQWTNLDMFTSELKSDVAMRKAKKADAAARIRRDKYLATYMSSYRIWELASRITYLRAKYMASIAEHRMRHMVLQSGAQHDRFVEVARVQTITYMVWASCSDPHTCTHLAHRRTHYTALAPTHQLWHVPPHTLVNAYTGGAPPKVFQATSAHASQK